MDFDRYTKANICTSMDVHINTKKKMYPQMSITNKMHLWNLTEIHKKTNVHQKVNKTVLLDLHRWKTK